MLSRVLFLATPWTAAHQASVSISWSLLKLMSAESVMPSSHLVLCRPLPLCLQSFPAAGYSCFIMLLVSGVQQRDSVIYIYTYVLFQILFPFGLLQKSGVIISSKVEFPVVYSRCLLIIYLKILCIYQSQTLNLPFPHTLPLW